MIIQDKRQLASLSSDVYLVVCYCAQWCRTCEAFYSDFMELAKSYHDEYAFMYIDIEEDDELLGDEDIDNFPTILIQKGQKNYYFGPVLPQIAHLKQLISRVNELESKVDLKPLGSYL